MEIHIFQHEAQEKMKLHILSQYYKLKSNRINAPSHQVTTGNVYERIC